MDKAYGAVDVPESVIDLLTGVRNYLQASAPIRLVGWLGGCGGGLGAEQFRCSMGCRHVLVADPLCSLPARLPCRTSASRRSMCPTAAS